jgi:hypothetical protein
MTTPRTAGQHAACNRTGTAGVRVLGSNQP